MTTKTPSQEEQEYFAKIEEEKLKVQAEKEAQHSLAQQAEKLRLEHWMRCPKCGNELVETRFHNVKIDRCPNCHGSWLDHGELEQLGGHEGGIVISVLNQLLKLKR